MNTKLGQLAKDRKEIPGTELAEPERQQRTESSL